MKGIHTEEAFEALIAAHLVEHCGYEAGDPCTYDRERALILYKWGAMRYAKPFESGDLWVMRRPLRNCAVTCGPRRCRGSHAEVPASPETPPPLQLLVVSAGTRHPCEDPVQSVMPMTFAAWWRYWERMSSSSFRRGDGAPVFRDARFGDAVARTRPAARSNSMAR